MKYRDWGGYGDILNESIEDDLDHDRTEVGDVACPVCGEPLDENDQGVVNCPLGHYRSDRAYNI